MNTYSLEEAQKSVSLRWVQHKKDTHTHPIAKLQIYIHTGETDPHERARRSDPGAHDRCAHGTR